MSSHALASRDTIEDLLEEHISARKLQRITGSADLSTLTTLVLDRIDSTKVSGVDFGGFVPGLLSLRFTASNIPRIRDLGTSLQRLTTLSLRRCGVRELDGIASFVALQRLDLAENEISDIVPLSRLERLQELDLSANRIADTDQLEYLGLLPELCVLAVQGNPLGAGSAWTATVRSLLPTLRMLNGDAVVPQQQQQQIAEIEDSDEGEDARDEEEEYPLPQEPRALVPHPPSPPLHGPPQTAKRSARVRHASPPPPASIEVEDELYSQTNPQPSGGSSRYGSADSTHARMFTATPPVGRPKTASPARALMGGSAGNGYALASSSAAISKPDSGVSLELDERDLQILVGGARPKALKVVRAITPETGGGELDHSRSKRRMARESSPIAPALK